MLKRSDHDRIVSHVLYSCIVLILLPGYLIAKADTIPVWLDTIAPLVRIQPESKWHSSVFQVTLISNEQAVLWMSVDVSGKMTQYKKPFTVARDGTYKVYYYGEDDFGNKSSIDSAIYVLDTRSPELTISPPPGNYSKSTVIRISADEPCSYFYQKTKKDSPGVAIPDSLDVKDSFEGFVVAVDSAGNRKRSAFLKYSIDTASFEVQVEPAKGIFNHSQTITFQMPSGAEVFYSFDPLAPPEWFVQFKSPVLLPHGLTVLRYYGKNSYGSETEIFKTQYILDTIPPKLHVKLSKGKMVDSLLFYSKEKSIIRFTLDGAEPDTSSNVYDKPVLVSRMGVKRAKARAWDEAGNASKVVEWEYKYDRRAPEIKLSSSGGVFNKPLTIYLTSDEPVTILYTLDGSPVFANSPLYTSEGITISKELWTILRFKGIDESGNSTDEQISRYYLDTRPPTVKVRIEGKVQDGNFLVFLVPSEPSRIHYQIGGSNPEYSSPVYNAPIRMQTGQVLKYFAVDSAGNASNIGTMDELRKPMVSAAPEGGVYNRKVKVVFAANTAGDIYWRILPDTLFRKTDQPVKISKEGNHSLEYYMETPGKVRSVIRRNEYFLDWTSPYVDISLRKGINDSVLVFFQCSENATIYYTIDGSNPQVSSSTRTAGNKFQLSNDRLVLKRNKDLQLAFYAEDAAGNQSTMSVLDLFSPRAVPNVPAGANHLYDRILSVTLNTFDKSTIYFSRKGKMPTTSSPVFSEPVTLLASDTIIAFVVDASGFRGEPDTFIYHIDLPPSPHFSFSPDTLFEGMLVDFDAGRTIDKESPSYKLLFRWDFDGDGVFETDYSKAMKVSHKFLSPGVFNPVMEVMDENKRVAKISRKIMIRERCSPDMISIIDQDGNRFCIDKYEWPNIKGKFPITKISWVEAKMYCTDAGKRLCTAEEWERACYGSQKRPYPYSGQYDATKCPAEEQKVSKAGSFPRCNEYGVDDMVGNVWEWVEQKTDEYPLMMGGSFKYGADAQCGLRSQGTIASRSTDTGFRCCK